MSSTPLPLESPDATSMSRENAHAPIRNEAGIRQVTPDPEFPKVKIPVVDDEDEYGAQKGLYQMRLGKAREAAKKQKAEEERQRKVADEAEKVRKEKEAEQERGDKDKEAEAERDGRDATTAQKDLEEAAMSNARNEAEVATTHNVVNDQMQLDQALADQEAANSMIKAKTRGSAAGSKKGKEVDPKERGRLIGSSDAKKAKPMARPTARATDRATTRPVVKSKEIVHEQSEPEQSEPEQSEPEESEPEDSEPESEVRPAKTKARVGKRTFDMTKVPGMTLPDHERCKKCIKGEGWPCRVTSRAAIGTSCNTCRGRKQLCTWTTSDEEEAKARKRKAREAKPVERPKKKTRRAPAVKPTRKVRLEPTPGPSTRPNTMRQNQRSEPAMAETEEQQINPIWYDFRLFLARNIMSSREAMERQQEALAIRKHEVEFLEAEVKFRQAARTTRTRDLQTIGFKDLWIAREKRMGGLPAGLGDDKQQSEESSEMSGVEEETSSSE